MRCPECHSDTASTLPRCTRCNALLDQQPGSTSASPDATAPWPPGPEDRHSRALTPGPAAGPQPEPELWGLPPLRRPGHGLPRFLLPLGAGLVLVFVLGIVFWPAGDKSESNVVPQQNGGIPGDQSQAPGGEAGADGLTPSGSSGNADEQATQVDAVLSDMTDTRTELGTVVSTGCDIAGLRRIRTQREQQLRTVQALNVDALQNGTEFKSALERALRLSIESNRLYLQHAPGCPSESAASGVNQQAEQAKAEMLGYWRSIAEQAGLAARNSSSL